MVGGASLSCLAFCSSGGFMNFLYLMLALVFGFTVETAFAVQPGVPLPRQVEFVLNNTSNPPPSVKLGTQVTQKKLNVLKAVYDVAVLGGASGSSKVMKDAAGGNAVLPRGAIIKQVTIDTPTALVASSGSPTISFGVESASTDIKGATAISTYNAGLVAGIQTGSAANMSKVAGDYPVGVKVNTNDLASGKVVLYIEYLLGQ